MKVLVVDDEEDICEMLCDELKSEGIPAEYSLTGEDAVRKMEREAYQLGVFDLKLATALTGLDVVKAFRRLQPNGKVIAMTGYIDEGLRQETVKLGACDFLVKPEDIQPENFLKRIREALKEQA